MGGAIRQARQMVSAVPISGSFRVSPQRAHAEPESAGISAQQAPQIGTEENCGRGEPHKLHRAGRSAQLTASRGLRSTRAIARHAEVSDGGTSSVRDPESLRKTHLTLREAGLRTDRKSTRL